MKSTGNTQAPGMRRAGANCRRGQCSSEEAKVTFWQEGEGQRLSTC